jgi:4-aminobutyrate aminotransferase/4-aminobutyrate aminotransferase/(S)-3-amino-2-methylpropionate transaminase
VLSLFLMTLGSITLALLIGVGGYHGNVLRLQPPLVIADADLDRAIDALADSLDAV